MFLTDKNTTCKRKILTRSRRDFTCLANVYQVSYQVSKFLCYYPICGSKRNCKNNDWYY